VVREEVANADPREARRRLVEHRRKESRVAVDAIEIEGTKRRNRISPAKVPMLRAVQAVLEQLRAFWPVTDRHIHYRLLNDPPLRHASKPESWVDKKGNTCYNRYRNDVKSYKDLCDLLTRARIAGDIPFHVIHDPTRPVQTWAVHKSTGPFVRKELDDLLKGYYRDLLQSQPNHVEIVGEKNTIESVVRSVASDYCTPYTIGRGYSSIGPRHDIFQRFRRSGKSKLILLFLSDFDPEGEDIAHSFARSMRDDFGIRDVVPVKVALTGEQVEELELPPQMKAKETSSRHGKFVDRHGDDVFELEAVSPQDLQGILRRAIDSVIDIKAFNAEIDREAKDARHLEAIRRTVHITMRTVNLDGDAENPD
jgi:hypothetical protein